MHFKTILLRNIPEEEIGLIEDVKRVLDEMLAIVDKAKKMKIPIPLIPLNCHVVTRLIARYIPEVRVIDGWYYMGWSKRNESGMCANSHCSHSWLLSSSGKTLIDPYPVDLVALGTVVSTPVFLPEELHDTPYHGAMKYLEGPIDDDLFDMSEILLNVYKFDATLKMIAKA